MSLKDDYLRTCKQELEELRAQLAPLESGEMHTAERRYGGDWKDTTQDDIAGLRRSIAIFEGIVAKLSDGEQV